MGSSQPDRGIFSGFAVKTQQFFGQKPLFFGIIFYIPATYILLGLLPITAALVCLWLFFAIRGYATPVLNDLINQNCDAATRATVLSIRSLIYRLGFATLGPLIGLIAGTCSLSVALVTSGTLLLTLSVLTGFNLYQQVPEYFKNKLTIPALLIYSHCNCNCFINRFDSGYQNQ